MIFQVMCDVSVKYLGKITLYTTHSFTILYCIQCMRIFPPLPREHEKDYERCVCVCNNSNSLWCGKTILDYIFIKESRAHTVTVLLLIH